MMAEKRWQKKGILKTELAKLKKPKTVTSHNLQPRELFPGFNPPTAAAVGFTPIVSSLSIMASPSALTLFLANQFSVNQHNSSMYLQATLILPNQSDESQNSSSTYIDKRQAEM